MIGAALGTVMDGIEARIVRVEADVSNGLPQFAIVGLPDSAVTESKLRIRSAIKNSGFSFPQQRITVNLSPASMKKRGAGLDLPIAVAILRASGQLPQDPSSTSAFCGELSLSGAIHSVEGIINVALCLHKAHVKELYLPEVQADEGVSLPSLRWYAVGSLSQVVQGLLRPSSRNLLTFSDNPYHDTEAESLSDVMGLENIKRGLLIAAVGGHHTFIIGPPGCGKTMLAQRYSGLLPNLPEDDALASHAIWQAAGIERQLTHRPPVRMPHHSLTTSGLIGGGAQIQPGEATLAHRGVLILDELLEFRRQTLDALREPLVNKQIHLARLGNHMILPADFQLLATLNPCPCGYHGSSSCRCSQKEVQQYWSTLSGPLLDRVDMILSIPVHAAQTATYAKSTQTSLQLRSQVITARASLRLRCGPHTSDSQLLFLRDFDSGARDLLKKIQENIRVSRRGLKSLERIARSISALDSCETVSRVHVEEAYHLRSSVSV